MAYESYFEAAAGHQRLFRGLYADFAAAVAAAPPGKQVGYNGDATTTRSAHTRRFISQATTGVVLARPSVPGAKMVFDLGGNVGEPVPRVSKAPDLPGQLHMAGERYPVASRARKDHRSRKKRRPTFSSQPTTRDWKKQTFSLRRAYCKYWRIGTDFSSARAYLPCHILINRTSVRRAAGRRLRCSDWCVVRPVPYLNRRSFIAVFVGLGYRLVDEWLTPDSLSDSGPRFTFPRRVPRILFRSGSVEASEASAAFQ